MKVSLIMSSLVRYLAKIVSQLSFTFKFRYSLSLALMAASFECEPPETENDREQLRSLR